MTASSVAVEEILPSVERGRGRSALKSFLKTSLPAVVDLSSQTIMWTIEAILIGKLSAAAFGGVGMAIQVIILIFVVLLTFIVGASVIIARYLGAGQRWEANHILGQALMMGILLSLLISIFWYFGATQIFKLIRETDQVAERAGVTYLRTLAIFAPLVITNFIALGILRGAGDTHWTMLINLTINFINLVLAPLLIFGLLGLPRLEVRGAALAVGIAHSVGFLTTLYLLRSRRCALFLSFRELTTPNLESFKRLFKTGLPTTIEQLVWAFGQLVVTSYAAILGVSILAAHQVFMRIQAILSMVYLGFALGAMSLMGKHLGAQKPRLAEKTAMLAGRVVLFFALAVAGVLWVLAKPMIIVFTSDPQVVKLGATAIKVFAVTQIPKAVDGVLMGNLRGAGDLKWLMWTTIISVLLLEIGLNWAVVFLFGLSLIGLWSVHCLDETLRLAVNYWRFKGGKWKFIDL